VTPPKVEPREMEGGSVEVLVSGLPQSKEEDETRSAVESHVGPVTLDLQRAEVAHMQTVQFLVELADHLATQQRLLRIVYRSLPTEPDLTERILDDSGVLAHPNIVAVPTRPKIAGCSEAGTGCNAVGDRGPWLDRWLAVRRGLPVRPVAGRDSEADIQ
jgi:hypothetical protein